MITAKTVRSKWFTLWWCPVSIKITSDVIIQSQIRPVPLSELMKIISPLQKSQKYFPVWSKIFPCQYVYGCGCWQAAGAGLSGNVIVCSVMCKELFIQPRYFTCIWAALSNKTTLSHHMLRGWIRILKSNGFSYWKNPSSKCSIMALFLVFVVSISHSMLTNWNWVVSESMNYVFKCALGDMCILEDLQMQCVLCLVTLGDSAVAVSSSCPTYEM